MQSVWRMVRTRIFLSVSLAVTSSGGNGLAMRLSVDARTGTLRCFSIFAAADVAMGFNGLLATAAPVATGIRPLDSEPLVRVPWVPGWGITIVSPQDGQLISLPAPELSTSSSCPHSEQLKIMSIRE